MDADEPIDWFLLDDYVTGKLSPAERLRVEQWIAAHADHQRAFAMVQAAMHARRHPGPRDWRRAEAIDAVMARVRAVGPEPVTVMAPRPRRPVDNLTAERLMQRIRRWFEGATELAAAMLLDGENGTLTEDEITTLRNRIDDAKRDKS